MATGKKELSFHEVAESAYKQADAMLVIGGKLRDLQAAVLAERHACANICREVGAWGCEGRIRAREKL